MTDYRTSDISTAPATTIIESFTEAGLPAPGSARRLARVADSKARLWLDDGARCGSLVDNTVNVLSLGPGVATGERCSPVVACRAVIGGGQTPQELETLLGRTRAAARCAGGGVVLR